MLAKKIRGCIALVIIMSMLTIISGCIPGIGPTVSGSGKPAVGTLITAISTR